MLDKILTGKDRQIHRGVSPNAGPRHDDWRDELERGLGSSHDDGEGTPPWSVVPCSSEYDGDDDVVIERIL